MLHLFCVLHVVNFARNSCLDYAGCVILCVSRTDRFWLAVSAAGRRVVPDVHPLLARSARSHDGATGHRLAAVTAAAAPSKFNQIIRLLVLQNVGFVAHTCACVVYHQTVAYCQPCTTSFVLAPVSDYVRLH